MAEPPYAFVSGESDDDDPVWDATVIPYLSDDSDATYLHFQSSGGHDYAQFIGNLDAIPSTPVTAITMTMRGRTAPGSVPFTIPPFLYPLENTNIYGDVVYYGVPPDNDGIVLPTGSTFVETTITLNESVIQDEILSPGSTAWAVNNGSVNWTTLDEFVGYLREYGFGMSWSYDNGSSGGSWDISSFTMTFETVTAEPVDVLMQGELLTVAGAEAAALRSVSPFAIDPELTNGPPTIAGADPGGVVVGTNPLLDGSDATYARTAITQGTGQVSWICVPLKSIPDLTLANFSRLTVYVRVKGTGSAGATYPLRFLVSFMTLDFRFISEFVDPAPISASFQVADSTTVDAVLNHTMLQGNSGTYADGVSDLIPKLVSGDCQLVFYVLTNFGNPNGSRYVGDLFELSVTTAHGVAEPVSLLMQGETLTWAEGASPGTLAVTSMLSAGTSLTEDFEGGTDGAAVTSANTIFDEVIAGVAFTNATAHSGTLSMRSSGPLGFVSVPYQSGDRSVAGPASGEFWFRYTGGASADESGIFTLVATPHVGDVYSTDWSRIIELVHNAAGAFIVRRNGGSTTPVDQTVTGLTAATWFRAVWSFSSSTSTASFSIRDAADTVLYSFTDQPMDGAAFAYTQYFVNDYRGYVNWIDDVTLGWNADTTSEPVSVLMQAPTLTLTGGA